MNPNTSLERVNHLMSHSDYIYDEIDQTFDAEVRYRRMLRVGINATALLLRQGETLSTAGAYLSTLPHSLPFTPGPLDSLANQYADVTRATIDRSGALETDARHAIHLMKLVVPYAKEHYPLLNANKIAVYALIHDIVEAYANDVPSLGISNEQMIEKNAAELLALETLKKEYGESWPEFVDLVEEYEHLKTPEARFNKTFDKLDPAFTHFYSRGHQLQTRYNFTRETFLHAIDETTARIMPYASEFSLLLEDRDELTRRVADIAYPKAA